MAGDLRIKGEDMQIRVTRNGQLMRFLNAINSMTFTAQFDILKKGYLGETTDRRDEIFRGVGIDLSFDSQSSDLWQLAADVRERAARRTALDALIINLTFSGNFPDGSRPRITTPDLKFGNFPLRMGGRDQYVEQTITAECEDFKYSPQ